MESSERDKTWSGENRFLRFIFVPTPGQRCLGTFAWVNRGHLFVFKI